MPKIISHLKRIQIMIQHLSKNITSHDNCTAYSLDRSSRNVDDRSGLHDVYMYMLLSLVHLCTTSHINIPIYIHIRCVKFLLSE